MKSNQTGVPSVTLEAGDKIKLISGNSNWIPGESARFLRWNPHNQPYAIIELRGDEYSAHRDDFIPAD